VKLRIATSALGFILDFQRTFAFPRRYQVANQSFFPHAFPLDSPHSLWRNLGCHRKRVSPLALSGRDGDGKWQGHFAL
jgi:hypothetical protein